MSSLYDFRQGLSEDEFKRRQHRDPLVRQDRAREVDQILKNLRSGKPVKEIFRPLKGLLGESWAKTGESLRQECYALTVSEGRQRSVFDNWPDRAKELLREAFPDPYEKSKLTGSQVERLVKRLIMTCL